MRVGAWIVRAAERHPGRVAVQTPAGSLTYDELLERAGSFASWLAAEGLGPEDRIALELPASLEFVVALHGCLLAGAPVVPVDLRLAERGRVRAGARLTIDTASACSRPKPGRSSGELRRWDGHDLDAVAVVIHTSGTTGAPKPVELTYGNWLWSALGSGAALGVDPDERWLDVLPLSHVGGLSILVRSAIYATAVVLHERFDTGAVLEELMAPAGPTLVSLVPTTLARLLDAGLRDPPRLRCVLLGGAPVPAELVARASEAGVRVSPTYGLTEACSQVTTAPPDGLARSRPTPDAGPPLFCTRVRVDAEGEILVRGPTVAPSARGADGWLSTGDRGELDEHGRLRLVGRTEETIISGGENVAPTEVEALLLEHPAVADAAVHGRPDAEWGEAVVASVVLRNGARVGERELREHCRRGLAPYKVPKEVRVVDRLPRTPTGKLLRRELT